MIRIENALSREIGLCAASIGNTALEIAIKTHMQNMGCADFERYVSRVQHSTDELRALVELIVVSETWFFRDPDVFKTLLDFVHGTRHKARPGRPLRILTIPCATGEEAYSIAMTLLDAGFSADSYRIHAFDVSERAVDAARRGIYGKNSFRGEPLGLRRRHFDESSSGELRVGDAARASVSIEKGNLLDRALLSSQLHFDVVFCRNVLIYLDRGAREKAFDNLVNWLASDGILFTGHAEAVDRMDQRFRRLETSSHFAYVRRQGAAPIALVAASPAVPRRAAPVLAPRRESVVKREGATEAAHASPRRAAATGDSSTAAAPDGLSEVARLADRGDLTAARRACERILASSGANAETYCLLGVVCRASGDADAALDCFTKALYLDQRHYESLVHMALLLEQRGEHASAANFRRRADRLGKGIER